ncbi:glutathione S-transferase T3-like [Chenopodium quinoa]|uniref:glutathione S-transferase T3-like n=1 Tax=Chenopodium quinoa TaxID=63459 RepID=UPI000B77442D|nr:glutathione S-transferase T3-like [Chenopodium quinoa]
MWNVWHERLSLAFGTCGRIHKNLLMDPNNPNVRQQFSGFSNDFETNPEFQFNTQFDDSQEESVPETPQYPPLVPRMQSNQVAARATRVWSIAEDEALIGLYLQISEDAIKGTNRKATDLWRNVHAAQMAHAEKPHILPPRPMKSLSSHWRRLAADTLQWISCYDEVVFLTNKDPKWRPKLRWSLSKEERKAACDVEEQGSPGSGKRSRDDVGDETPTDGFSSGGIRRPDGVKKAKAKRKGKAVATESGSSDLGERMKEFATIREREANLKE